MRWAPLVALAMIVPATAVAQTVCERAELERLAATITPAEGMVPRPAREAAGTCMSVGTPVLTLGAPVIGTFDGDCPVVAMIYTWTTMVSETCGNDVHFPPRIARGVVVLQRHGERWRRVASGEPLILSETDGLTARDLDGDGRDELLVGTNLLLVERRRVLLGPPPTR